MMKFIVENYVAVVFIILTILAVLKWFLTAINKNKMAEKIDELTKILNQTFGNVELLKAKWKESGCEEKYGHIGEIFAKINSDCSMETIIKPIYEKWLKDSSKSNT